ncbi:MAG: FecR domain-containing protein [Pseudomonadota bacterium]
MDDPRRRLRAEALELFLALQEHPRDARRLRAKERFCEQSTEARRAYEAIVATWQTSGHLRPRRRRVVPMAAAAIAAVMALFIASDFWPSLNADIASGRATKAIALDADSTITLDAGTALSTDDAAGTQTVSLAEGAAFFDIAPRDRQLDVVADDLVVTVIGTRFSVEHLSDGVSVAVQEGQVQAVWTEGSVVLQTGDRLRLLENATAQVLDTVDPGAIAAWRSDRLVVSDTTFAEVAAVIDRRLPGRVVIASGTIAEARLTAAFSLSDPLEALRAAAAAKDARVIALPPFLTVVAPNDLGL